MDNTFKKNRCPNGYRRSKENGQCEKYLVFNGGWKSIPKSDPELWNKVLLKVKREEPGKWAAWKSIKAVNLYKKLGGKYLRN